MAGGKGESSGRMPGTGMAVEGGTSHILAWVVVHPCRCHREPRQCSGVVLSDEQTAMDFVPPSQGYYLLYLEELSLPYHKATLVNT